MKQRGVAAPVSADDVVRITTADGTHVDWPDKTRRTLANVRQQHGGQMVSVPADSVFDDSSCQSSNVTPFELTRQL